MEFANSYHHIASGNTSRKHPLKSLDWSLEMRLKLTDLSVAKLPFKHPQYTAWDALLPGFGCRVGSRSKTWIVMHGKERKRLTIGRYPVMSLQKAREAARLKISNPLGLPSDTSTVAHAVTLYLKSIQVSSRTHIDYTRLLNSYLSAELGSRRLEQITTQDILALIDKIKDRPGEARHAYAAMQTFFNWCVPRYISQSPMVGLKPPSKPGKRSRVLSYAELAQIWAATEQPTPFNIIVRLCLLTGQRRGELSAIRSVNLAEHGLVIPAGTTKNRREHFIPLPDISRKLVKQLTTSSNSWSKNKKNLDARCDVSEWTLHDLRRTFATNLAELGVEPHIIERLLNHSSGQISGVAAIYNRFSYQPQMRAALELYQQELVKRGVFQ